MIADLAIGSDAYRAHVRYSGHDTQDRADGSWSCPDAACEDDLDEMFETITAYGEPSERHGGPR